MSLFYDVRYNIAIDLKICLLQVDINECLTDPCVHGNCSEIDAAPRYECACDPGWEGPHCDKYVPTCQDDQSPCMNGECYNLLNGTACK